VQARCSSTRAGYSWDQAGYIRTQSGYITSLNDYCTSPASYVRSESAYDATEKIYGAAPERTIVTGAGRGLNPETCRPGPEFYDRVHCAYIGIRPDYDGARY
jgi:hypothetical protein